MGDDRKQSREHRFYRRLLRLLPFDFQRDYGQDMENVFEQERAEAGRRTFLWWRTARGITRTAFAEHINNLSGDIRLGVRTLSRNPGFTVGAVLMLALGIGVNAIVFTLTNAILFKGFPYLDSNDRFLYIHTQEAQGSSYPDIQDWRAQAKSFEGMAIVNGAGWMNLGGSPQSYLGSQISSNTFQLIGQRPVIGRDFAPSDEAPGAPPVVILSDSLWERHYKRDPAIVGRTVRLNGVPTTVVGVMTRGFSFPYNEVLWVPVVPNPDSQKRETRYLWLVMGRLVEGVSVESARAEMETIGRRLESAYPKTNAGFLPLVQTYNEHWVGQKTTLIYESMWGAVGFVLLIACANLANLMLSRAMGRSRDIALRIALGAGRWRIVRQLLIESVMLSVVGGLLGWWIARLGVSARIYELAAFSAFPNGTPSWYDFSMDYRVLGYLVAISIGTGLLFGLAPALRLSNLDINAMLKDGGRGAIGTRRAKRLSSLLVIGEMALAMVLLVGAGVMIRSFLNIYTADLGVDTANIVSASLELPNTRYPDAVAQIGFVDRLKARLESIPGVESVANADALPTEGSSVRPYELADAPIVDLHRRPTVRTLAVSSAYFQTMGAGPSFGREFTDADGISGMPVAIVNQRFSAEVWPGQDAIGKRLRLFAGETPEAWLTVVGIAPNIIQNDRARQRVDSMIYLPFRQEAVAYTNIIVRTHISPGSVTTPFLREIQSIDPDLPVRGPATLNETLQLQLAYRSNRAMGALFLIFAGIALLLAAVGLYGLIAHSVNQQTQEIGIRIAIGAQTRDILQLVFSEGMLPLGIGLVIGLAASLVVNRVLQAELVQVSPTDPTVLVVASAVLIASAALGCWIPARRAMRVDPMVALRHE